MAGDELKCPKCGAKVYLADSRCLSCGARLDEGKLVEPAGAAQEPSEAVSSAPEDVPTSVSIWALVRGALWLSFTAWQLFWPLYSAVSRTAIKAVPGLPEGGLFIALPPRSTWGIPVRPLSGEWWMALGLGLFLAFKVVYSFVRYQKRARQGQPTREAEETSTAEEEAPAVEGPGPHPHYTSEQVAEFKRQFQIKRMVHQIGTYAFLGIVLLMLISAQHLFERMDGEHVFLLGIILPVVAYVVFLFINGRCPVCGRNMFLTRAIKRGLPSPCPHCGFDFS